MIRITQENSTFLKYIGSKFELHTDLDIGINDILEIPCGSEFSNEIVVEIKDLTSNSDRHHGDIINKHYYILITKRMNH